MVWLENTRGENSRCAKLNDDAVREMRRLRDEGATYGELARRYGVTMTTVRHACIGLTWRHVQ